MDSRKEQHPSPRLFPRRYPPETERVGQSTPCQQKTAAHNRPESLSVVMGCCIWRWVLWLCSLEFERFSTRRASRGWGAALPDCAAVEPFTTALLRNAYLTLIPRVTSSLSICRRLRSYKVDCSQSRAKCCSVLCLRI